MKVNLKEYLVKGVRVADALCEFKIFRAGPDKPIVACRILVASGDVEQSKAT